MLRRRIDPLAGDGEKRLKGRVAAKSSEVFVGSNVVEVFVAETDRIAQMLDQGLPLRVEAGHDGAGIHS